MRNIMLYLMLVVAIVFLYGFSYSINAHDSEGKKVFTDKKCMSCHTVESEGIESKKKDAHDLSTVGTDRDADFFMKYLKKEEKIEGKEHKIAFKGTDEELKDLADFLATLKKDEEKTEE
jgi:cytochrome c553